MKKVSQPASCLLLIDYVCRSVGLPPVQVIDKHVKGCAYLSREMMPMMVLLV